MLTAFLNAYQITLLKHTWSKVD